MLENLSTGIEASATVESLNSGDPAVYRAARYSFHRGSSWSISKITPKVCFRVPFYISNELSPQYMRFCALDWIVAQLLLRPRFRNQ